MHVRASAHLQLVPLGTSDYLMAAPSTKVVWRYARTRRGELSVMMDGALSMLPWCADTLVTLELVSWCSSGQ